jgi:hypothetical protein
MEPQEIASELRSLAREIDVIKNNHLAHIADDITRLEKTMERMDGRLWWVLGLIVAAWIGQWIIPVLQK